MAQRNASGICNAHQPAYSKGLRYVRSGVSVPNMLDDKVRRPFIHYFGNVQRLW